jgi:hypothetical protein
VKLPNSNTPTTATMTSILKRARTPLLTSPPPAGARLARGGSQRRALSLR